MVRLAARLLAHLLSLFVASGCSTIGFVTQAALGQWELASAARPIPEVIQDPDTPERTRRLLSEIQNVRRFAWQNGLNVSGNYEEYVELPREYPVWFVNASHPLAFAPKVFSFPIVGSFPGLAWFDKADAEEFRDLLIENGWDVNMRGVSAFSTGGWFDDPLVWSMLSDSPGALASLVNTVIHESLHATILIKDQQYYNESLASFVGDTMAGQFLQRRSGERMPRELRAYLFAKHMGQLRAKELNATYQQLDAVYKSSRSVEQKLAEKQRIIDELVQKLRLVQRPNNATLIGFRLYHVGKDDFSELYAACGYNWRRFLKAASSLSSDDFGEPQRAEFGPVVAALTARGCTTELYPIEPFERLDRRLRTKQQRRLEAMRQQSFRVRVSEAARQRARAAAPTDG